MKLENTSPERIAALTVAQRAYFGSGATLGCDFRREQLRRLAAALKKWERPLCEALWQDLHKSEEEAVLTELSIVAGEIRNHLRHLRRWMRWERRGTPLKMFPSRSRIVSEPLGCALIVAPWNYPLQLLLNPLVGAISAGCTALLKPSPYVPNVALAIERMIAETFDEQYISVVQGNRDVNGYLLSERFDVIFFTGSPSLGRIVMRAAAEHLTPVVLELGGKSPCIVDRGADVDLAARRIVWGKTLNAGQTCIAPDYLMIYRPLRERFMQWTSSQNDTVLQMTGLKGREEMYLARYLRTADTPWYRQLMHYNPADYLPRVKVPVLALNGDCDIMVPAVPNLQSLDSLLHLGGNRHYRTVALPGLNHMFQHCVTCRQEEIPDLPDVFAEEALEEIFRFLQRYVL